VNSAIFRPESPKRVSSANRTHLRALQRTGCSLAKGALASLLLKADALSFSNPPHTSPANDACASSTGSVLDRLLFENRRVFFLTPAIILASVQLRVSSCEKTSRLCRAQSASRVRTLETSSCLYGARRPRNLDLLNTRVKQIRALWLKNFLRVVWSSDQRCSIALVITV